MASAKQLAALKKARAARKSKTVTKVRKKTAKNVSCQYVVKVLTSTGKTGYFKKNAKGLEFDTELSNAECGVKRVIDNYAALIYSAKPRGIVSVEVVKK